MRTTKNLFTKIEHIFEIFLSLFFFFAKLRIHSQTPKKYTAPKTSPNPLYNTLTIAQASPTIPPTTPSPPPTPNSNSPLNHRPTFNYKHNTKQTEQY